MSEKNDAATPRGCERSEELVAYLYGETTDEESGLFSRHLEACASCREELGALGGVRDAFGVWRAQVLGSVPSLNIGELFAPARETLPSAARGRSARAALREFFSLSPLWLRAGAFAATLAVCALVLLTLARAEVRWGSDGLAFRAGVTERVVREEVHVPTPVGYTEEQVNELVARRVSEETERLTARAKEEAEARRTGSVINASVEGGKGRPQSAATGAPRRKRATRTGVRREETLLAEDDLPRLSDLLSGSY